ncbi:hypothetical protein GUJ93_ZPchr0007g5223 [Zizania palustris]|uniref:Uncharacterized protein n=1 Tax=Zizania palustris TaxID=103762 RepID=A0A8J5TJA0_ZIZPA|nr:hypothetical protein GUJ93_ZPchr0007g5223 [Zizania palustris]
MALNHISRLCKSVDAAFQFYVKALGSVEESRLNQTKSFDNCATECIMVRACGPQPLCPAASLTTSEAAERVVITSRPG